MLAALAAAVVVPLLILQHRPQDAPPEPEPESSLARLRKELRPGRLTGANLLLVTLDTVRRDRLGCYGYAAAQTPTLDGLAARGIRFDHAVTTVPTTLPSHATILTGLEVPRHGVRTNGKFRLKDEHTTLAEVLRSKGYSTAAFVSSAVLMAQGGLNQGFEVYDDRLDYERTADATTQAALDWLAGRPDGAPAFFLWVHYYDAHWSYEPPEPFATQFSNRLYDGEIAFVDHEFGRLLARLEELGLSSRTLVAVLADHGEGLGEHLEQQHGHLIYDTTVRIPLILAGPFIPHSGHRVDDVAVGTIDVMPTLLSLLGVEAPSNLDGLDLLTAEVGPERLLYLETLSPLVYHGWSSLHGVRSLGDKFILAPTPEYFDLQKDAQELVNLLEQDPSHAGPLPAELDARLARWPSADSALSATSRLRPEEAQRLAALGYVSTLKEGARPPDRRLDPKDVLPIQEALQSDSAEALRTRGWELVRAAGADRGTYRRALLLAEEASRQEPDAQPGVLLLGVARYRAGQYEEALAPLTHAAGRGDETAHVFQAMAWYRLGRLAEAQAALSAVRARNLDDVRAQDAELQGFLNEAQELIGRGTNDSG